MSHSDSHLPARTRRSADLWALARADYLAGGSAPEVCERHGLSLSTFRHRARVEGWRRVDQVETPVDAPFVYEREYDPGDWHNFAEELDRPPPVEGMRPLNAEHAIRAGRMIEARGWTRIHRDLAATSRHPAEARAAHVRRDLLRVETEARKERARLQDLQHQVAQAQQAALPG